MSGTVLENSLRLKYRGKYVEFRLTTGDDGLLNVSVNAPVSGQELSSFKKISTQLSRLVFSGVRSRRSILGKMNRMVGVDHEVLKFMRKVVTEHLPLDN